MLGVRVIGSGLGGVSYVSILFTYDFLYIYVYVCIYIYMYVYVITCIFIFVVVITQFPTSLAIDLSLYIQPRG